MKHPQKLNFCHVCYLQNHYYRSISNRNKMLPTEYDYLGEVYQRGEESWSFLLDYANWHHPSPKFISIPKQKRKTFSYKENQNINYHIKFLLVLCTTEALFLCAGHPYRECFKSFLLLKQMDVIY